MGSALIINAVIACPSAGTAAAATVARDILRSFKALRFGVMVDVGAGAPYYGVKDDKDSESGGSENEDSEEEDLEDMQGIRLGDCYDKPTFKDCISYLAV